MQSVNSLEKTLILGQVENREGDDKEEMVGWVVSPTQWT